MDLKLAGKIALVTSSSRGIGLATAHAFAAEGCRLMLSARSGEQLAAAEKELRATGAEVAGHSTDAAEPKDAAALIDAAVAAYGGCDILVNNVGGGRFNRPNDVICHSNGCIYFTDPDKRRPYHEREIPGPAGENNLWDGACVYRLAPDGGLSVLSPCEYPNGLALSPDERTLYVANTRSSQYIHAIKLDAGGHMVGRSIFADLNGTEPGIPDGLKIDSIGRVYCTGPGGIWVIDANGTRIGVIRWPEQAVNFAFGGPDLRTLFCCAHTSVYTLQVKVPGNPHPWYKVRGAQERTI